MPEAVETIRGVVDAVFPQTAVIRVDAAFSCPRCSAGEGCGAGLLGADRPEREIEVSVPRGLQLVPGDAVKLTLPARRVMRAAVIAYGLPLAALVVAVVALSSSVPGISDLWIGAGALGGLALGIVAARVLLSGDRACNQYTPEIAPSPEPAG